MRFHFFFLKFTTIRCFCVYLTSITILYRQKKKVNIAVCMNILKTGRLNSDYINPWASPYVKSRVNME